MNCKYSNFEGLISRRCHWRHCSPLTLNGKHIFAETCSFVTTLLRCNKNSYQAVNHVVLCSTKRGWMGIGNIYITGQRAEASGAAQMPRSAITPQICCFPSYLLKRSTFTWKWTVTSLLSIKLLHSPLVSFLYFILFYTIPLFSVITINHVKT